MFVARESFTAQTSNGEVAVTAGVTIVAETDEVYWRYAGRFDPVKRPEVEQATNAPGEKRGGAA